MRQALLIIFNESNKVCESFTRRPEQTSEKTKISKGRMRNKNCIQHHWSLSLFLQTYNSNYTWNLFSIFSFEFWRRCKFIFTAWLGTVTNFNGQSFEHWGSHTDEYINTSIISQLHIYTEWRWKNRVNLRETDEKWWSEAKAKWCLAPQARLTMNPLRVKLTPVTITQTNFVQCLSSTTSSCLAPTISCTFPFFLWSSHTAIIVI